MSITVYSRSTCAPCRVVKTWLQKNNIIYEEKNLDENPEYGAEAFEKSGFTMVPVTVVGDEVVSGMNLSRLREILLDKPIAV